MLGKILRFGAVMSVPLAFVGAASAQNGDHQAPQESFGLILYSGKNYTGEVREVFEPAFSLNEYYFNDDARSVGVISGAWEICEHSDFTGRCILVRHDVPDLDWYGLSRELSSVRPIYEYTEAEHGLMFHRDRYGNIQYADRYYGGSDYAYGYSTSYTYNYYHYGYSPSYVSHGYYNPSFGYGPYGFAYTRHGYNPAYRKRYRARRHARPLRGHYGAKNGAVTLYTDSYGRGASLGLNRGISNLSDFRFNDNVSSLTIKRGKWQVCEHANFRGRCQIVDASVDRLNGIRLNDNISSIRPVGDVPEARSGGRGRVGDRRRDRPRAGDSGRRDDRDRRRDRRDRRARDGRPAADLAGGPGQTGTLPRMRQQDERQRGRVNPDRNERERTRRAERLETPVVRRNQPREVRRATIEPPRVQPPRNEARRQERRQETRRQERGEQVRERRRLPDTPAMRSRQSDRQVRPQPQQRQQRVQIQPQVQQSSAAATARAATAASTTATACSSAPPSRATACCETATSPAPVEQCSTPGPIELRAPGGGSGSPVTAASGD